MTDPNGVVTTLRYTTRGWLDQLSTNGRITTLLYSPLGVPKRITFPDQSYLEFGYSDGGRLINMTNQLKETLSIRPQVPDWPGYGDIFDDVVETRKIDGSAVAAKATIRYDSLGRYWKMFDVGGSTANALEEVVYHADGQSRTIKDGKQREMEEVFDGLGRLASILDRRQVDKPLEMRFGYDSQDQIESVTDQEGKVTTYVHDGFGNLLRSVSPDAGTTTYYYDDAGNMTTRKGPDGVSVIYTYDSLNRLKKVNYPGQPDETYTYDETVYNGQPIYGIGHLTAVTRTNGESIRWAYDPYGNVMQDERRFDGQVYTTGYGYTVNDELETITYPGGNTLKYVRVNGQVKRITLQETGTNLISNITYEPLGPVKGLTFGNGLQLSETHDLLYRLDVSTVTNGILSLDYRYDKTGAVDWVKDLLSASGRTQSFGYDPFGRLGSANGAYGTFGYLYSDAGDRKSQTWTQPNGTKVVESYGYLPKSHRLTTLTTAGVTRNLGHTVDGSIQTDSANDRVYGYNQDGRLIRVTRGGVTVADYGYNALGQRQSKQAGTQTRRFVYGPQGELLAEIDPVNQWERDYVYLGGRLVAMLHRTTSGQALYFVHTDHLGTPLVVTNGSKGVLWSARYEPFGKASVDVNKIAFNVRLPGQYYDAETGLHYNYFRDYDPATGRYIETDPIGLAGGINPYAYAASSPTNLTDRTGQCPWCVVMVAVKLWNVYETLSEAADTAKLVMDPCASGSDKMLAVGSMVVGALNPLPVARGIVGGAAKETVRIRHYTSNKGLTGIKESGVIRASDQNKVFAEAARGKPLSPRDAEAAYGLKQGRGRNYIETDVPADRVMKVYNPLTRSHELQVQGDVPLGSATFHSR